MVGAGIVLDIVQHWNVFKEINELFILVPALLGLKGNLEMTLASRLSTLVRMALMHCCSALLLYFKWFRLFVVCTYHFNLLLSAIKFLSGTNSIFFTNAIICATSHRHQ